MKCKINLTNALNIDNLTLTMGNRVIFCCPNIDMEIEDGGQNTAYLVSNKYNNSVEDIYKTFLDSFLITTNEEFKKEYHTSHTVEKDLENGNLVIEGDKVKFNSLMSRIKEYEKLDSELLALLQGLYNYISTKNINININDINLKLNNNKLLIIFSKNDSLTREERIEYNIGDTVVKILWKYNDKFAEVNDDISLYIAKVKFKKLEKELNDLFELETKLEFDQPDLSGISQEMNEFDALLRSFLTVGVNKDGFVNAAAFRYTYNNGVMVKVNENESIFIGRHFGVISFNNKATKSTRSISILDDRIWKSLNRPEIYEPLKAIYDMSKELDFTNNFYNNKDGIIYTLRNLGEFSLKKLLPDDAVRLLDPVITFSRTNDTEFKFIYTYNENYKMFLTYNGLLKIDIYKNDTLIEGIYISDNILILVSTDKSRKQTKNPLESIIGKFESFRTNLNILSKYFG